MKNFSNTNAEEVETRITVIINLEKNYTKKKSMIKIGKKE